MEADPERRRLVRGVRRASDHGQTGRPEPVSHPEDPSATDTPVGGTGCIPLDLALRSMQQGPWQPPDESVDRVPSSGLSIAAWPRAPRTCSPSVEAVRPWGQYLPPAVGGHLRHREPSRTSSVPIAYERSVAPTSVTTARWTPAGSRAAFPTVAESMSPALRSTSAVSPHSTTLLAGKSMLLRTRRRTWHSAQRGSWRRLAHRARGTAAGYLYGTPEPLGHVAVPDRDPVLLIRLRRPPGSKAHRRHAPAPRARNDHDRVVRRTRHGIARNGHPRLPESGAGAVRMVLGALSRALARLGAGPARCVDRRARPLQAAARSDPRRRVGRRRWSLADQRERLARRCTDHVRTSADLPRSGSPPRSRS